MNTNETGGPAFPNPRWEGWGSPQEGMTLRDYFAAKAMQGFAAAALELPTIQDMAACAYGWADAMLQERNK